jgi:DNA-binding beta-propeller fold protein YncE
MGLNDVTVARGGRVFATDSGNGAVYEIPREGDARVLVPAGQLRGSNGIAASPDAKRIYVAHSTGIAVVDVATGAVKRLENPTRETIAAIDGLYEWQGELIGVQNVTNPGRVILIALAKDGESVVRVRTLLSHHHNRLDEPTTGAIRDSDFLLLAATGTARFNDKGTIDDPATVPKPTVVRVLLPR